MRTLAFIGFCALAFAALPAQQAKANSLGTSCTAAQIGITKIDTDNRNIVACLVCTTGNPNNPTCTTGWEWSPLTMNVLTSSQVTCPNGITSISYVGGVWVPTCE